MVSPLSSAVSHAFTLPGSTTAPAAPVVPPPLPAAQQPAAKPGSKGMQSSFLSGVAGSGAAFGAGVTGGGQTGKTLLGQ